MHAAAEVQRADELEEASLAREALLPALEGGREEGPIRFTSEVQRMEIQIRKQAALYVRVSTDDQSIEQQRAELVQLALSRGFEAIVYEDVGVSGARASRPGLDRLMDDARRGKLSAVLVWSLDRLDRNMARIIDRIATLERHGAPVLSVREGWMSEQSQVRQLLIAVLGWVAEFERQRISERTKAGLARVRRLGSKSGRPLGRRRADDPEKGQPVALYAALDAIRAGKSVRAASREWRVPESTLRRYRAKNGGAAPKDRPA